MKKPRMPKFWTDASTRRYNNRWYKWYQYMLKQGYSITQICTEL
jgi:hypothetical protein